MKLSSTTVIFICFLTGQFSNLLYAQDNSVVDSYFIITNKKHVTIESFNIGDSFKLKLKSAEKVSGVILSIQPDHITTSSATISYDEIHKIRKLKNRTVPVVIGSTLIAGGVITFLTMQFYADFDDMPKLFALSVGLIGAGAIMIPPKYHNLTGSKALIVISN